MAMPWRTRSIKELIPTTPLLHHRPNNPISIALVRSKWLLFRLCSESDIVDNSVRRFCSRRDEILVGKLAGKNYALDEICTHRGGPCRKGLLKMESSRALWHHGQFDLATGEVRGPPPADPLKSYELRVEGSDILISIVWWILPDHFVQEAAE